MQITYEEKTRNLPQMLRKWLFPHFRLNSLTFLLICLHSLTFALCVLTSGVKDFRTQDEFLALKQEALFNYGENYPYFLIKEREYWRLLSNGVLAVNFTHLLSIILSLLILGSHFEWRFSRLYFAGLFLFSTLASGLETALFLDSPCVGGSFFSLGLIGCISSMSFSYNMMEANGNLRENEWKEKMGFPENYTKEFQYLINAIWAFDLLSGIRNRDIDLFGNAMAVINGYFMGWVFMRKDWKGWNLLVRASPGVVLTGLFIGTLFRNPDLF